MEVTPMFSYVQVKGRVHLEDLERDRRKQTDIIRIQGIYGRLMGTTHEGGMILSSKIKITGRKKRVFILKLTHFSANDDMQ
jgi:hypothetical protein